MVMNDEMRKIYRNYHLISRLQFTTNIIRLWSRYPSRWPRDALYPQKLALTSPTSGGKSVGVDRSRNKATEFSSWRRYILRPVSTCSRLFCLVHAGTSNTLFFSLEDGSDKFLRKTGWHSTGYTACISQKTKKKTKLRGLSPRANYTDRATAVCLRSYCQLFWI
jgi:hypothetical protein